MGINKNQPFRVRIIDRELHRKRYVKTSDLVRILLREFDIKVQPRTIQKDIEAMKYDSVLGLDAPIEYDQRRKAWYYTDPNFTIQHFKLREDEVNALRLHAANLEIYKDAGVFQLFSGAIEKVLEAVSIQHASAQSRDLKSAIQVEAPPVWKGVDHIPDLVKAIEAYREVRIRYRKYGEEAGQGWRTVRPYLLKVARNRWYLIGKEPQDHPKAFALDRIGSLQVTDTLFEPEDFDFDAYYEPSLGITAGEAPVEVVVRLQPLAGKYVKSLPIHASQEILSENENGVVLRAHVRPTYELYEWILGLGDQVEVLEPAFVRDAIREKLLAALKNYD